MNKKLDISYNRNVFFTYFEVKKMKKIMSIDPIEAAKEYVESRYPNCDGAILAGSVVRGQATGTSDLDIVIIDDTIHSSYRESLIYKGWSVEIFAHNQTSYPAFFESDCKRARPCLPRMVSEGIILKDTGILQAVKEEAAELLANGPEEWTTDTITIKRYFLTDVLEDFIGSNNRGEEIFIAGTLAELSVEFVLRTNKRWIGSSKWVIRALKEYDSKIAEEFIKAFDDFYKSGEKVKVVTLIDRILDPHGGRLFEGFSLGKE
jgi:hypothetical protein